MADKKSGKAKSKKTSGIVDQEVDQEDKLKTSTQETSNIAEDDGVDDSVSLDDEVVEKAEAAEPAEESKKESEAGGKPSRFKRSLAWYKTHKKLAIPLTVFVVLGLVFAIPATRYPVLALFGVKDEVTIGVYDESTKKGVASATVTIDGQTGLTDNNGKVKFKVKVGKHTATASKKYYSDGSGEVFGYVYARPAYDPSIQIKATGRQVPVSVMNKISGKPVENATVKAADTEVKTNREGKAVIVVPTGSDKLSVEVGADKFNQTKAELKVTEASVPENTFKITPSGKVYFLSKQSGKIDVVKTNLDGSERQTVVGGTGQEEDYGTALLASRDWRYLALLSKRDSKYAKLYVIDTTTDKMTTADEGDAALTLVGWNNDSVVYQVDRLSYENDRPAKYAIKAYNATTNKISVLEQSEAFKTGNGSNYSIFDELFLLSDRLVYSVKWDGFEVYMNAQRPRAIIKSISVNGTNKKELKSFSINDYLGIQARPHGPEEIYYSAQKRVNGAAPDYFEYKSGAVKMVKLENSDVFYKETPTYLLSPSGKRVFWSESRDGKSIFFTGDMNAEDTKQVADLVDHRVYGWFTDDYVLVTKKHNEMYIMSVTGGTPIKVADFHRIGYSYRGFGGEYGGL